MAHQHQESPVSVQWLGTTPGLNTGTTFGIPWPRGSFPPTAEFACQDEHGTPVPLQSWQTGLWPDGSLKWSAHALPATTKAATAYQIYRKQDTTGSDKGASGIASIRTDTTDSIITVHTGSITVEFSRHGPQIIRQIRTSNGTTVGSGGQLVLLTQPVAAAADPDYAASQPALQRFEGRVDTMYVEQDGPIRTVVIARGTHHGVEASESEPESESESESGGAAGAPVVGDALP